MQGAGRRLGVALVQLRATPSPTDNLARVRELLEPLADQLAGALVVCPEATMAPFAGVRLRDVAEPLDGRFADGVRGLARDLGATLVVGLFEPASGGRVHNTLLLTDGGDTEAVYRKRHVFDAFGARESDTVEPGHDVVTVDVLGTRIALATCFDVRFADDFVEFRRRRAEVVCLPASWAGGRGKQQQWRTLTSARALDAQAWLLAADQAHVASDGSPLGIGCSRIVDPMGGCRGQLGRDEGVLVRRIDLDAAARARHSIPLTPDERVDECRGGAPTGS